MQNRPYNIEEGPLFGRVRSVLREHAWVGFADSVRETEQSVKENATVYDQGGRKLEYLFFDLSGVLSSRFVYSYHNDLLWQVTTQDSEGTLLEELRYSYASNGDLAELTKHDRAGVCVERTA